MTPPPKDRARASRLRAKLAKGGELAAADAAWLAKYERARGREPAAAKPAPKRANVRTKPAADPTSGFVPIVDDLDDDSPAPPSGAQREERGDDDDAPAPSSGPTPSGEAPADAHPTCGNPECLACAGELDGIKPYVCPISQRETWPLMKRGAAELAARVLLGIVGLVIKVARGAPEITEPTPLQVSELADGLAEIARRNFGWVAAWSDFGQAMMALGAYVGAAMKAPIPEPARAPA